MQERRFNFFRVAKTTFLIFEGGMQKQFVDNFFQICF